jgi:hypothetical protein
MKKELYGKGEDDWRLEDSSVATFLPLMIRNAGPTFAEDIVRICGMRVHRTKEKWKVVCAQSSYRCVRPWREIGGTAIQYVSVILWTRLREGRHHHLCSSKLRAAAGLGLGGKWSFGRVCG